MRKIIYFFVIVLSLGLTSCGSTKLFNNSEKDLVYNVTPFGIGGYRVYDTNKEAVFDVIPYGIGGYQAKSIKKGDNKKAIFNIIPFGIDGFQMQSKEVTYNIVSNGIKGYFIYDVKDKKKILYNVVPFGIDGYRIYKVKEK
ncbi:hypothetical protein [Dysgonomonas massiliensis]|uniref:hypothetical protein n=1 Tax=Dysgonomonas massiliensis TaxID=2040292 RepID=UPI000C75C102|nr:hypothetical protein [Dysgonomonas massiliensis]